MMHLLLPLDKDKNIKMNRLLFPYNGTWNSVCNRCVLFHTMSVKTWSNAIFTQQDDKQKTGQKIVFIGQNPKHSLPSFYDCKFNNLKCPICFSAELYLRFIFMFISEVLSLNLHFVEMIKLRNVSSKLFNQIKGFTCMCVLYWPISIERNEKEENVF